MNTPPSSRPDNEKGNSLYPLARMLDLGTQYFLVSLRPAWETRVALHKAKGNNIEYSGKFLRTKIEDLSSIVLWLPQSSRFDLNALTDDWVDIGLCDDILVKYTTFGISRLRGISFEHMQKPIAISSDENWYSTTSFDALMDDFWNELLSCIEPVIYVVPDLGSLNVTLLQDTDFQGKVQWILDFYLRWPNNLSDPIQREKITHYLNGLKAARWSRGLD